jgi:hypothetical protein
MLRLNGIIALLQQVEAIEKLTDREYQAYRLIRDAQMLLLKETEIQMLKDLGEMEDEE